MDIIQPDETPAQAWEASLDATCNRLMSQYLSLLRAAAPATTTTSLSSSSGSSSYPDQNDGGAVVHSGVGVGSSSNSSANIRGQVGTDPRAGGWLMRNADDPPPPLAADVLLGAVQAKLAAENLCVASSNALDLIRTLRLSVLLLDEELIRAEEEEEALELLESSLEAEGECAVLEAKLSELRSKELMR
ncbi:hypothetical protein ACHAWU_008776 [Discostella pseudostelligera]|uniref:Mediator of RNA polymerase II transcription subunit 21 n=1 Tax=Discostella pseudostelligera TaxID=259834 RepID=A0ABD3MYV7_9STRA